MYYSKKEYQYEHKKRKQRERERERERDWKLEVVYKEAVQKPVLEIF